MKRILLKTALCASLIGVLGGGVLADSRSIGSRDGGEGPALTALLDACVAGAENDLRQCVGRVAAACGAPSSVACIDVETESWDAVGDRAAVALSAGRESDAALVSETRADVLTQRSEACAAISKGDAHKAALCRRSKAVDRAIVFRMLLSLEGGAR